MSVLSEREPQPLTAKPHADGTRPPLGSGGPSRSENTAPPAAVVRAALDAPTQWGGCDPDARRDTP
jgi:hypothetical protein